MQKKLFKSVDTTVILKKITPFLLFIFILLAFPQLVKSNILENGDDSKIIVSGDVTIFESVDLRDENNIGKDSKEIAKQKAVIVISEGASITNIDAFKNAKVLKLEKTKSPRKLAKKKIHTQRTLAKTKNIKSKTAATIYNSKKNSGLFSQSQKEQIIFSPIQPFSKAIVSIVAKKTNRKLHFSVIQNFRYTDPSIRVCYLLGKHSVRPPTSFA